MSTSNGSEPSEKSGAVQVVAGACRHLVVPVSWCQSTQLADAGRAFRGALQQGAWLHVCCAEDPSPEACIPTLTSAPLSSNLEQGSKRSAAHPAPRSGSSCTTLCVCRMSTNPNGSASALMPRFVTDLASSETNSYFSMPAACCGTSADAITAIFGFSPGAAHYE